MSPLLGLRLSPGSYACIVEHPVTKARLSAQIDLQPARRPGGEVYDWPTESDNGVSYIPQPPKRFDLVKCDLRNNLEVVLYEVTLQGWFPGRARLGAEVAIVGHALHEAPERGFPEVSLQITHAQRLFGVAPIGTIDAPEKTPASGPSRVTVTYHHDADRVYQGGDLKMRCRYWWSYLDQDYFQFRIRTAPVIELASPVPLTPTEWLIRHVLPLRELVTLATLAPQRLA